jgi:hypothetical protein
MQMNKARIYLEKFIGLQSDIYKNELNRDKLLGYLTRAYNESVLHTTSNTFVGLFKRVHWQEYAVHQNEFNDALNAYLAKAVWPNVSHLVLANLVSGMFASNFISPNTLTCSLMLLKLIQLKKTTLAIEFFKSNLSERQVSAYEIQLLAFVMQEVANRKVRHGVLDNLVAFMHEKYETRLVDQFLFWAYTFSGELVKARGVFEEQLDSQLELEVLERCMSQMIEVDSLASGKSKELSRAVRATFVKKLQFLDEMDFVPKSTLDQIVTLVSKFKY